jgi:hypothetical protein
MNTKQTSDAFQGEAPSCACINVLGGVGFVYMSRKTKTEKKTQQPQPATAEPRNVETLLTFTLTPQCIAIDDAGQLYKSDGYEGPITEDVGGRLRPISLQEAVSHWSLCEQLGIHAQDGDVKPLLTAMAKRLEAAA